jgi:hypothetical protein
MAKVCWGAELREEAPILKKGENFGIIEKGKISKQNEKFVILEDDDKIYEYIWEKERGWERVRITPFKVRSRREAARLVKELGYPVIGAGEERGKVVETFKNLSETWADRGDKNKALTSIRRGNIIVCSKVYKRQYLVIWWW